MPEDVRKQVLKLKEDIIVGKKSIWEGPITKQDGTVVVPAGQKRERGEGLFSQRRHRRDQVVRHHRRGNQS